MRQTAGGQVVSVIEDYSRAVGRQDVSVTDDCSRVVGRQDVSVTEDCNRVLVDKMSVLLKTVVRSW